MRETIYQAIITLLKTCTKLQGENGTIRVYDFPLTAPDGYPYAVVGSESLESSVLDNARDSRRYNYLVQIVGEKFGSEGAMTQEEALSAMRATEDAVLAIFDHKNGLNCSSVVRTMPTKAEYGYTDNNARVVLTIHFSIDTMVDITY
jgi:hypothetical protein